MRRGSTELYRAPRAELRRKWSELTFRMQALRDDPLCAREAFDAVLDRGDPGLNAKLTFALESRDVGQFGMNTPAFFAADNLVVNVIPEPGTWALLLVALFTVAAYRRIGS